MVEATWIDMSAKFLICGFQGLNAAADIRQQLLNRNGGQASTTIAAFLGEGTLDRAGKGKSNDPYFYVKC